ncbi:LysR family transcriptional regulator [Ferrimonas kyonanensis]|uniref:LysR family transcriptional regulator n=1 Tax=Ferrimonas kyonanensis TaxID=364763 RepID=UPI000404A48C|nr:LysR family transcriptional regulator [Ferrimonas kyonanensis]
MDMIIAMRSFARVVESGSFSDVAREESTTQATISKRVAALEKDLGAQLLIRGSRTHSLTETGKLYYDRVVNILHEIEEAESEVRAAGVTPKGKLRVTLPSMFGSLYVAPLIPEFLSSYPEIQLDLKFTEKMLNLVEEGVDLAIRLGNLEDSSLIARPLGSDDLILVSSPGYLAKHPAPLHPSELTNHNCLVYSLSSEGATWSFTNQKPDTSVRATGNFQCDTGSGLLEMLLADTGIAFMPRWLVGKYLESGQLVQVLNQYYRRYPINAVYPQNRYVPLKTRCFLDFMTQKIKGDAMLNNNG